MELRDFINLVAKQVAEFVHNAPPKTVVVDRHDHLGNKTQQQTNLPQLLAELSDQLKVTNLLAREGNHIRAKESEALEENAESNTEVARVIKKAIKERVL